MCGRGLGHLEIMTEGEEFVDEIRWNVEDVYGDVIVSNDGQSAAEGGFYYVRECIALDSCYTFSIRDTRNDTDPIEGRRRAPYKVRLGGEEIVNGNNFRRDQTTIFGSSCALDGDAVCTTDGMAPTSMFRLEFAVDNGWQTGWSLLNGSGRVVRWAGPFGDCNVNTVAMCLPRDDCYEFTVTDNSSERHYNGLYTVMFSRVGDIIQKQNGTHSGYE